MNVAVTKAIDNPNNFLSRMVVDPEAAAKIIEHADFNHQALTDLINNSYKSPEQRHFLESWLEMLRKDPQNEAAQRITLKLTDLLSQNAPTTTSLLERDWNLYKNKKKTFTGTLLRSEKSALVELSKELHLNDSSIASILKHLEPSTAACEFNKKSADGKLTYWNAMLHEYNDNVTITDHRLPYQKHEYFGKIHKGNLLIRLITPINSEKAIETNKLINIAINKFIEANQTKETIANYFKFQDEFDIIAKNKTSTPHFVSEVVKPIHARLTRKATENDADYRTVDWLPDSSLCGRENSAIFAQIADEFSREPNKLDVLVEKEPLSAIAYTDYLFKLNPTVDIDFSAEKLFSGCLKIENEDGHYYSLRSFMILLEDNTKFHELFYRKIMEMTSQDLAEMLYDIFSVIATTAQWENVEYIRNGLSGIVKDILQKQPDPQKNVAILKGLLDNTNYIKLFYVNSKSSNIDIIQPMHIVETMQISEPSVVIDLLNLYTSIHNDVLALPLALRREDSPKMTARDEYFDFLNSQILPFRTSKRELTVQNLLGLFDNQIVFRYSCYDYDIFRIMYSTNKEKYPASALTENEQALKKLPHFKTFFDEKLNSKDIIEKKLNPRPLEASSEANDFLDFVINKTQNFLRNIDKALIFVLSRANPDELNSIFDKNSALLNEIIPLLIANEHFGVIDAIFDKLHHKQLINNVAIEKIDLFHDNISLAETRSLLTKIVLDLSSSSDKVNLIKLLLIFDFDMIDSIANTKPDDFKQVYRIAGTTIHNKFPEIEKKHMSLVKEIGIQDEPTTASAPVILESLEQLKEEMKKSGVSYMTTDFLSSHPEKIGDLLSNMEELSLLLRNLQSSEMDFEKFLANAQKQSLDVFLVVANSLLTSLLYSEKDEFKIIRLDLFNTLLLKMKEHQELSTENKAASTYISLLNRMVQADMLDHANALTVRLPNTLLLDHVHIILKSYYQLIKKSPRDALSPFIENFENAINNALNLHRDNNELRQFVTKDDGILKMLIDNLPHSKSMLSILLTKLETSKQIDTISLDKFSDGHGLDKIKILATTIYTEGNYKMAAQFSYLLPKIIQNALAADLSNWMKMDADKQTVSTLQLYNSFMTPQTDGMSAPPYEQTTIVNAPPVELDFKIDDEEILQNIPQSQNRHIQITQLARLQMDTDNLESEYMKLKAKIEKIESNPELDIDKAINDELEKQESIRKLIAELSEKLNTAPKPH